MKFYLNHYNTPTSHDYTEMSLKGCYKTLLLVGLKSDWYVASELMMNLRDGKGVSGTQSIMMAMLLVIEDGQGLCV